VGWVQSAHSATRSGVGRLAQPSPAAVGGRWTGWRRGLPSGFPGTAAMPMSYGRTSRAGTTFASADGRSRPVAHLRHELRARRVPSLLSRRPGHQLRIDLGEMRVSLAIESVRVYLFRSDTALLAEFGQAFRHEWQSAWLDAASRRRSGILAGTAGSTARQCLRPGRLHTATREAVVCLRRLPGLPGAPYGRRGADRPPSVRRDHGAAATRVPPAVPAGPR
jgi:hypothetical protein